MVSIENRKSLSVHFPFYLSCWCSVFLIFSITETSQKYVIPFGTKQGHIQFNGKQKILQLNQDINFVGKMYHSVEILENGLLRFLESSKDPELHLDNMKPQVLPLVQSIPFVAAYWTEPALTNNGTIWYKEVTNRTYLANFHQLISYVFPSVEQKTVKHVLFVTWEDISYNNSMSAKNTFQSMLVSMEDRTYLILKYEKLDWGDWRHMPDTNSTSTAVAGYDGGNGNSYLMLSGPKPNDILTDSNVNISGMWIVRVDQLPCIQKDMTGILALATILCLLIGIVIGVLCTCFCLRKIMKKDDDSQPLNDHAELPVHNDTNKSSEQLIILPPSNTAAPIFPNYEASLNIDPHHDKPAPRKIRVIKKNLTPPIE